MKLIYAVCIFSCVITHKQQVQIVSHVLDHLIEESVAKHGIVWGRIELLGKSTADEATAALRGARYLKELVVP